MATEKATEQQSTGTAPTDSGETQSQESANNEAKQAENKQEPGETQPKEQGNQYPETPKEEKLAGILDKEKVLLEEGKEISKELSNEDIDILDEYYAGKLKPKKKEEAKAKDESSEKPEDETEEKLEGESEENEPEENKEEKDSESDVESSAVDLQLMKEVGAKNKAEVLEKIKGLRKAVSGKISSHPKFVQMKEDNAKLGEAIRREMLLFDHARQGRQEALDHIEKNYGLKFVVKNSGVETESSQKKESSSEAPKIDKDKFLDSDAANEVNNVIEKLYNALEEQKDITKNILTEREKEKEASTKKNAEIGLVDEMVTVSEQLPKLKSIPNIREAIQKWLDGTPDPRMEYYRDLFEIGNSKNVDLITALEIDRGRKARLSIAKAKDEGKKEAYERTPNRSLSDLQGKKADYGQYTEEQVEKMVREGNFPDEWFDANDRPDKNKIPQKLHKHFF